MTERFNLKSTLVRVQNETNHPRIAQSAVSGLAKISVNRSSSFPENKYAQNPNKRLANINDQLRF